MLQLLRVFSPTQQFHPNRTNVSSPRKQLLLLVGGIVVLDRSNAHNSDITQHDAKHTYEDYATSGMVAGSILDEVIGFLN
jgi:hypothetical protein